MRAPKGIGRLKNRVDRLQPATGADGKAKATMFNDGGGLYLLVAPSRDGKSVNRSWIFRYVRGINPDSGNPKQYEIGLGALRDVPASQDFVAPSKDNPGKRPGARQIAAGYRWLLDEGKDPLQARRTQAVKDAAAITFREAAERCIAETASKWKSSKHAAQWPSTLKAYAYDAIGNLRVGDVDTDAVKRVVRPIWDKKHATARRLLGRIKTVLQWAISNGFREGPNPARWTDHLEHAGFPTRPKHLKPKSHASLPYKDVPAFMVTLGEQDGQAAECLRLVILTACRTGEAIGARWPEIDLDAKTWKIPPERMKAGRAHTVPLSAPAVELLRRMLERNHPDRGKTMPDAFVFPGRAGKSMSNMAMLKLLERMERDDVTVHGFRDSFKSWALNRTSVQNKVIESALAHGPTDETDAAYGRDMLEKHTALMTAWGAYVTGAASGENIVNLERKTA